VRAPPGRKTFERPAALRRAVEEVATLLCFDRKRKAAHDIGFFVD